MRWTVEGADKSTGRDRVLSIEAESIDQAEQIASGKGLLVSAVYEATNLDPAEQLERMASNSAIKFDPPHVGQPIAYQSLAPLSRRAPEYVGLKIGGSIVLIFAGCYYAMAAVLMLLGAISAAGVTVAQNAGLAVFGALTFVIWGLGCLMIAGILHAASAGCDALRDIARNSFSR